MCGVVGVFNDPEAVQKTAKALSVIKERGRDGCGIAYSGKTVLRKKTEELQAIKDKADYALGHVLHSIVGFVQQPIQKKGFLAANNEIYNWKEIAAKHNLDVRNDSELIIELIEKRGFAKIKEAVEELDGACAFAYWDDGKVVLCRDIFGVKPLWYAVDGKRFAFASERKALDYIGFSDARELNPREILTYEINNSRFSVSQRSFFEVKPELKLSKDKMLAELNGLLIDSVAKRIPDQKFGILFSGGVDSVLVAKICKDLGADFTCYTAALESETEAEDLAMSKKAAAEMGFELKVKTIKIDEVEAYFERLIPLIEDNNVVKVGVGLTFYVACELAREDGIKVMFSGLGAEELFAGYERHKEAANVNDECLSGLRKIYERDTYRDDVITMNNNLELRLPFLDRKLTEYSLKIPAKYKIDAVQNKKIMREAAEMLGVPREFAQRKKRAAQYGSRFDNALDRLTARARMKSKSAYLAKFYSKNPILGVLFSSGKDSCYAMWKMKQQNYPIKCLITMRSRNPDSYMFHTPNIDLAELQALGMNVPIVVQDTPGEKEEELSDLKKALEKAKKQYGIEGVVTGALYSQYQRERIEKVCDSLGLKIFSPLWHMDQEKEMRQILDEGFEVVLSSVAAEGLDASWLGKRLTAKEVDKLVALNKKLGINAAGEGGEFESLVLDGPMFNRRIVIADSEIIAESRNTARFVVKKAKLVNKNN
jgi:asparagine synthase (glutamine-hydrolysing)